MCDKTWDGMRRWRGFFVALRKGLWILAIKHFGERFRVPRLCCLVGLLSRYFFFLAAFLVAFLTAFFAGAFFAAFFLVAISILPLNCMSAATRCIAAIECIDFRASDVKKKVRGSCAF